MERLSAATNLLEKTVAWLEQREVSMTGELLKITAAVEEKPRPEEELQKKLAIAEQQIAELRAQACQGLTARKTVPAVTAQLLAKQGITTLDSVEAGALDAALTGLSIEQRIAVKSQLMRAGALV
jgi:hypothetical protein